jgi:hypothetical protein
VGDGPATVTRERRQLGLAPVLAVWGATPPGYVSVLVVSPLPVQYLGEGGGVLGMVSLLKFAQCQGAGGGGLGSWLAMAMSPMLAQCLGAKGGLAWAGVGVGG